VLPALGRDGAVYRKFQCVLARRAVAGEAVVSVPSDGRETSNVAGEGDYVVRNLTEAGELYIVRAAVFRERYELEEPSDHWSRYRPLGRVRALEVGDTLLTLLAVRSPFYIEPSWKEPQLVVLGDYLVCPLGANEIYRIARQEFGETYVRS
jgi:hypothetical protein